MLTNKGKYGLKAMTHLAGMPPGQPALVADIAAANSIPKKFLELILLDLKHAGYVRSKQGSKGGYRLVRDPSGITLAEIYRLFDGAIALVPCVSQKFYEKCDDCPDEKVCRLKPVFIEVREKTYESMAGITIKSFLEGAGSQEVTR